MKLSNHAIAGFCRAPDLKLLGVLLYGPEPGLTALNRQNLVSTIADGDDLRITRLRPTDLRSDPASLDEALRARGFFPGRRVVLIEDAADAIAAKIGEVIDELNAEDAFLIVTASNLTANSSLRKLFEKDARLASGGIYADAPDSTSILQALADAGFDVTIGPDGMPALLEIASGMDPGSFRQFIEKIGIYSDGTEREISGADIRSQAPASLDSEIDRLIAVVAEGRVAEVDPVLKRLSTGQVSATQILILAGRHFRSLVGLVNSDDGIEAALGRLRPPAFGPRRQALARQATAWGRKAEEALRLLYDTDRRLRSPGQKAEMAMVERCLLRLAMMGAQRR